MKVKILKRGRSFEINVLGLSSDVPTNFSVCSYTPVGSKSIYPV